MLDPARRGSKKLYSEMTEFPRDGHCPTSLASGTRPTSLAAATRPRAIAAAPIAATRASNNAEGSGTDAAAPRLALPTGGMAAIESPLKAALPLGDKVVSSAIPLDSATDRPTG